MDFIGFWANLSYTNMESISWTKIKRINKYIDFCDETFVFLDLLFFKICYNNKIYTKLLLDSNKMDFNYSLLKNGFYVYEYIDASNRLFKLQLSFYDSCFWLILNNYGKAPKLLHSTLLNFNFVDEYVQKFCRKIFEHEHYIRVFFKDNEKTRLDFSQLTKLDFKDPYFNIFEKWDTIYIGNSFELIVWFFLVDLSGLGPISNYDEFFYLKYVVLLQYNFKYFLEDEDFFVKFNSYKIVIFCLIKLSKIFKKKFEFIKNSNFFLKTWNELFLYFLQKKN